MCQLIPEAPAMKELFIKMVKNSRAKMSPLQSYVSESGLPPPPTSTISASVLMTLHSSLSSCAFTYRAVAVIVFIVEDVAFQQDLPPTGTIVVNLCRAIEPADVNRGLQGFSNYAAEDDIAAVLNVSDWFAHQLRLGHCQRQQRIVICSVY